eukprot:m.6184 g.6184  ORF g.6184 m.6184 type:complete len:602 (+) comp3495_c0_seq1:42-1847(+)
MFSLLVLMFVMMFRATGATVEVVLPDDYKGVPLDGRVLVFFSKNLTGSPINECGDDQTTSQVFGVDVLEFTAAKIATISNTTLGYPRKSLKDIPPGKYLLQAQLLRYVEYNRSVGKILLPVSCVNPGGGDGEYPAPVGTLFSKPMVVEWEGYALKNTLAAPKLVLSNVVPKTTSPGCAGMGREDTEYMRTFRMKSPSLSEFWGRDIVLESCVLLPYGWNLPEHKDAKYPLIVAHGHYSAQWFAGGGFIEFPPPKNASGYDKIAQEGAYELYQEWIKPEGVFKNSRALVIQVNHENPFFDDSYAVNSENLGPYGDAITYELIPAIEKEYRGISQGWARGLFGGSTGGWESIGVQVKYPAQYNGAHAACPDPITFSSYTTIDIYKDHNAYVYDSDWKETERPGQRDHYSGQTIGFGHPYGQTTATVREMNYHELVLGTKSRSCGQWDIWEAVFGPRSSTGFPERIWDKFTGIINKTTAEYWKKHFDLAEIMKSDAERLAPILKNKIHIYVGGSDTYFLTNAVMDMQDFLESSAGTAYNATVLIGTHGGRGFEHCFNGYGNFQGDDTVLPNSITRLHYVSKFVPELCEHFAKTAPPNADLSWRY